MGEVHRLQFVRPQRRPKKVRESCPEKVSSSMTEEGELNGRGSQTPVCAASRATEEGVGRCQLAASLKGKLGVWLRNLRRDALLTAGLSNDVPRAAVRACLD